MLRTTSEIVSFAKCLEETTAALYLNLAQRGPEWHDIFLALHEQNVEHVRRIQRTYQNVISDALEAGFAFRIEHGDFSIDASEEGIVDLEEGLRRALSIERNIGRFYRLAAEQSRVLMADIPRAFDWLANERDRRVDMLGGVDDPGSSGICSSK